MTFMICGPLDLPDDVVTALEQERLVIFAGAGVSMGPPADLPSFDRLAKNIAGNPDLEIEKPIDELLGDLVESGVKVHELCRGIIDQPGRSHNVIHADLLRLFRSAENVRIVTTNFDPHFSGAATAIGWTVPTFEAPMLPLGRDFAGIVHLHGSTRGLPRRMVLTDADFGGAYLTDAWASTFLRSLFAEFTILFIGYSHQDPPIRYLARGLTGRKGPKRFALTADTDVARWRSLGIVPVPYAKRAEPDVHGALNEGVRRWAEITLLQPLEVEDWMRKILTGPTDILPNPTESDFLRRCLQRDDRAHYFVRYAQHPRWIEWLAKQQLLAELLATEFFPPKAKEDPEKPKSDAEKDAEKSAQQARHRIAHWLGEQLPAEPKGYNLWLVRQAGGVLGPVVAAGVAMRLWRDDGLKLTEPLAASWVALVCRSPGPPRRDEMLGRLLDKLARHTVWPAAFEVLSHLCAPVTAVEETLAWDEPEPRAPKGRVDLRMTGGASYLSPVWEKYFRPALPTLADELLPLFESVLQSAHRLARSFGEANDQSDPLLVIRSRIQTSSPYTSESDLAHVVTYLCEVVGHQAGVQRLSPDRVREWLTGANPILCRVGLHALAELRVLTPVQKFEWLVNLELHFKNVSGARHEVYALAKLLHPALAEADRARLWAAIEAGPPPHWAPHLEAARREEIRQREIDRFVLFLHREFPTDPLALAAFARLENRAPEYVKAKQPDLDTDFVMGEVRDGAQSPKTVEEMLKTGPVGQLDYLLTFKTEDPLEATREGLVGKAATAASQNPVWGMELLRALAARGEWTRDLWDAVFWQLSFAKLHAADQLWLLSHTVDKLSADDRALNGLTFFLFRGGLFAKETPVAPEVLEALADVSVALWPKTRTVPSDEHDDLVETEWVNRAINSPAGRLVEFWLQFTEYERSRQAEPAPGWPARFAPAFDELATAQTPADWHGLAIVGLHLAFVRFVAPDWVRAKIYPLLDFEVISDRAWPLWQSFVAHSRFNRDLLLELPRYYPAAAPRFAAAPKDVPRDFLASVGLILYSGLLENVPEWLRAVLQPFNEAQRAGFASSLARSLHDLPGPDMAAFWRRWMSDYWRERLNGRPFALTAAEAHAMLDWVWLLPPNEFTEAVPLVHAGPKFAFNGWTPMFRLLESPLPAVQPHLLLDLWVTLIERAKDHYVDEDDYRKLLNLLPQDPTLTVKWQRLCQALSAHGAQRAKELFADGQAHFAGMKTS